MSNPTMNTGAGIMLSKACDRAAATFINQGGPSRPTPSMVSGRHNGVSERN